MCLNCCPCWSPSSIRPTPCERSGPCSCLGRDGRTLLRPLCCERSIRARSDGCLLEAFCRRAATSTILAPALGDCAGGTASHGLRSGNSGTRVSPAGRLAGRSAAHPLDPLAGNTSLLGVHASAAGTVLSLDARSTFRGCDVGYRVSDLERLACKHCARSLRTAK